MGRSTNVPFSILISARLPLLTLRASATAFGMRTARLFPHLQNSTIMALSPQSRHNVYTMQLRFASVLDRRYACAWLVLRLPNAEQCALFAGSDGGAEHWAIIASLIETCKLLGIEPHGYLADVMTRIVNGHPQIRLD